MGGVQFGDEPIINGVTIGGLTMASGGIPTISGVAQREQKRMLVKEKPRQCHRYGEAGHPARDCINFPTTSKGRSDERSLAHYKSSGEHKMMGCPLQKTPATKRSSGIGKKWARKAKS